MEARERGEQALVGLVSVVFEKNAELCLADPCIRGCDVVQCDIVRLEKGEWAIFDELGSFPATMDSARCADAYGLI